MGWYDKFRTSLDALSRCRRVASANRLTPARRRSHPLGLQDHVALVALAVLSRRELYRPLAFRLLGRRVVLEVVLVLLAIAPILLCARQALQFHRGADR